MYAAVGGSYSQIVTMMETAEPLHRNASAACIGILLDLATSRRLLLQPQNHPVFVVGTDIFVKKAS
jgi:hypothetical protein